jgi:hypothetical protein
MYNTVGNIHCKQAENSFQCFYTEKFGKRLQNTKQGVPPNEKIVEHSKEILNVPLSVFSPVNSSKIAKRSTSDLRKQASLTRVMTRIIKLHNKLNQDTADLASNVELSDALSSHRTKGLESLQDSNLQSALTSLKSKPSDTISNYTDSNYQRSEITNKVINRLGGLVGMGRVPHPNEEISEDNEDTPTKKSSSIGKDSATLKGVSFTESNSDVKDEALCPKIAPTIPTSTPGLASEFQYKIIKGIVDDVVSEHFDQLQDQIQNMHIDLIRQFQVQKVINY